MVYQKREFVGKENVSRSIMKGAKAHMQKNRKRKKVITIVKCLEFVCACATVLVC